MKTAWLTTCLLFGWHVGVLAAQRKVLQAAPTGSVQDLLPGEPPQVSGRRGQQIIDSSMSPYSAIGLLASELEYYTAHCTASLVAPSTAVESPKLDPTGSCLANAQSRTSPVA